MADFGYSSLMQNLKGDQGRWGGLSKFLDVQQAFLDAQKQHQYQMEQTQQAGNLAAAKGIAETGLSSGTTPDAQTAMQQYQQLSGQAPTQPTAMNAASGGTVPQPTYVSDTGQKLYGKVGEAAKEKNQGSIDKKVTEYTNRVDTYMKRYSGQLGPLDAKVTQAILTRTLVDQYYDPNTGNYNMPPSKFGEVVISLGKLLNPTGVITNEQLNLINQASLKGDYGKAATYATGKLWNGNSQEIIKDMIASVDREGLQAENQREKYLKTLRSQVPEGLNADIAKKIADSAQPPSFKEYLSTPFEQRKNPEGLNQSPENSQIPSYNPSTQKLQRNIKTGEYRVIQK